MVHAPARPRAHNHEWVHEDAWTDSGGGRWVEERCKDCDRHRRRRPGRIEKPW